MKIGIDIDGTITAHPAFFSKLSLLWDDDVYAVTFRPPNKQRDLEELQKLGVCVTDILYANQIQDKAVLCEKYGIEVLFDDIPDFLVHCKANMAAFLVRGEMNFDPKARQFVFTNETGRVQEQY